MKKYFFVSLFLSLYVSLYSQVDSTVSRSVSTVTQYIQDSQGLVIPDSAQVTMSTVYKDLKSGIASMAAALKVGSEHVYGILVKQQLVYSLTYILIGIIGVLGLYYSITRIRGPWLDEEGEPTFQAIKGVPLVIIFSIMIIYFMCNITDTVTGFINPEYGAITDILELINK